jgi:hypothetical protein
MRLQVLISSIHFAYLFFQNIRVQSSFLNPFFSFGTLTPCQSLILRLKHSGREDGQPLEVTLGSTIIQLNHSSKSSLTIDDLTLSPIPGPSEPDHLSFEPEIRNDIFIQFGGGATRSHGHLSHISHGDV